MRQLDTVVVCYVSVSVCLLVIIVSATKTNKQREMLFADSGGLKKSGVRCGPDPAEEWAILGVVPPIEMH